ncbi:MAG TPA: DUF2795 domain-containing protein [Acidimicrobiales bacterium]|jgi:hypothetical protein|nr:DUF2795 domain-containing protein [Acidimicrobiales bacterium]
MQRESDKHSPRVDDALAHDSASLTHGLSSEESRSQEFRVQEEETEDDVRWDLANLDARAELARHVTAAQWPAAGSDLVQVASADHAPEEVVTSLRQLPAESRFDNVQEVWSALGGVTERPHTHG